MKTPSTMIMFALLVAMPAFAADAGKTKPEAMSINAAEIKWGPAPPDLPKGAEIAVLHGDPSKKAPFTLRLKVPAGFNDEYLTILAGTLILHISDTIDAPATTLAAGGFHFLPGKMHHAAEAKGETIVQLEGMGPFDIHYLNPADNPNPAAASKKK